MTTITNDLLDDVASRVSEYLTHYIDGQATVTITPSMVEAVLVHHDLDQIRKDFGESADWVASLIRESATEPNCPECGPGMACEGDLAKPYCGSCGRHHAADESHCPNCGQSASSGFHATWQLDKCPIWINGRGWVPMADTTPEERKATWPVPPWA